MVGICAGMEYYVAALELSVYSGYVSDPLFGQVQHEDVVKGLKKIAVDAVSTSDPGLFNRKGGIDLEIGASVAGTARGTLRIYLEDGCGGIGAMNALVRAVSSVQCAAFLTYSVLMGGIVTKATGASPTFAPGTYSAGPPAVLVDADAFDETIDDPLGQRRLSGREYVRLMAESGAVSDDAGFVYVRYFSPGVREDILRQIGFIRKHEPGGEWGAADLEIENRIGWLEAQCALP